MQVNDRLRVILEYLGCVDSASIKFPSQLACEIQDKLWDLQLAQPWIDGKPVSWGDRLYSHLHECWFTVRGWCMHYDDDTDRLEWMLEWNIDATTCTPQYVDISCCSWEGLQ